MNMKQIKIFTLAAVAATVALSGAQAGINTLKTSKGGRLALESTAPAATQARSAMHASCPAMKDKPVQREQAADSKEHNVVTKSGVETSMPGCRFAVQKEESSKQAGTVMQHHN